MHYFFDCYELDTERFELRERGVPCRLQAKPLDLLALLIENRGRVVLKSELRAHLWPGVSITDNALAQAVASAREAISGAGNDAIVCVRSRGYRFTLPVVERLGTTPPPAAEPSILTRWIAESLASNDGFVLDVDKASQLDGFLERAARRGMRVIRATASSTGPLSTFRHLVATMARSFPATRIGAQPLAEWAASNIDEHAFVAGVLALFNDARLAPSVLVIEHLERADIASVLLFGMLAPTRRPGLVLLATCSLGELARSTERARIQPLLTVARLVAPRVRRAS